MGSPISGYLAEAVLQELETRVFQTYKPKFWMRYVDDTFVILHRDTKDNFKRELDSVFPQIQFTMEEETNGVLSFLDVQVSRQEDGTLQTGVFRKATDTEKILHYNSNHPLSHKRSCVRTLFHRMHTHCSTEAEKLRERKTLWHLFLANGYPRSFVNKCLYRRHTKTDGEKKQRPEIFRVLPYVRNVSEATERMLRPLSVGVGHRPEATIRRLIMQPKDRLPPADTSGVIYHVKCLDCPANYCGMTDKRLRTRMHEHTLAVRRKDVRSHVAMRCLENNHTFDFDGAQVLGRAESKLAREVIEAWKSDTNSINRNKPLKSAQVVICGKNFPREHTMSTPTFKNCQRLMVWIAIKFGERPVWRSTAETINSKVFIDIVKDAFGYNGIHRRRMDTVMLQDNAHVHGSKEVAKGPSSPACTQSPNNTLESHMQSSRRKDLLYPVPDPRYASLSRLERPTSLSLNSDNAAAIFRKNKSPRTSRAKQPHIEYKLRSLPTRASSASALNRLSDPDYEQTSTSGVSDLDQPQAAFVSREDTEQAWSTSSDSPFDSPTDKRRRKHGLRSSHSLHLYPLAPEWLAVIRIFNVCSPAPPLTTEGINGYIKISQSGIGLAKTMINRNSTQPVWDELLSMPIRSLDEPLKFKLKTRRKLVKVSTIAEAVLSLGELSPQM
ncbi:hypothetical protein SprV_0200649100 [Sparganum proliferum]